jgi:hypothetical protein
MSTRPDPDLLISSWLRDDARDGASDRLLAATRRQIESTKQRRAWWPAWRLHDMNSQTRLAVTGAAVIAVAAVGLAILPRSPSVGPGGTPSPSSTVSPSPTPSPAQLTDGPLAAGTYTTQPFTGAIRVTLTVPDGWQGFNNSGVLPTKVTTGPPDGMGLTFMQVSGLHSDPCHGTTADVPVGPSVSDLVTALRQQTAYETSTPVPTTLSGFSGQLIDVLMPTDVDFATCTNGGVGGPAVEPGSGGFFIWQAIKPGDANIYAQGPGDRFHLRILDVGGSRVVVMTQDFPGTSEANRTELQAIVDSIEIN